MVIDCPDDAMTVHVGANVMNLWPKGAHGVTARFIDPSWSGWGGDLAVSTPLWRCLRVGLREQVVFQVQDETLGVVGRRTHLVSQLQLGGELSFPWRVQVGAWLLPGVRTVFLRDQVNFEAVETDYRDTTVLGSWSAMLVARVWATPLIGGHLSLRAPVADFSRAFNFADQFVGLGIDLRVDRRGADAAE
jgi:hypothetical protein